MRGFRTLALAVVVFAMSVGFATAQSLAELAKKEKERRDGNPSEAKRVVTDRELTRGYGELSTPSQTQEGGGEATDAASDTEETCSSTRWASFHSSFRRSFCACFRNGPSSVSAAHEHYMSMCASWRPRIAS